MARIPVGDFAPDYTKTTLDLAGWDEYGYFNSVPSEHTAFGSGDSKYFPVSSDFPDVASKLKYSSFADFIGYYFSSPYVTINLTPEEIFQLLSTGSGEALMLTAISSTKYKIESSTIRLNFDSDGFSSLNFSSENINNGGDNPPNNGGNSNMAEITDAGYKVKNGSNVSSFPNIVDNLYLGAAEFATVAEMKTFYATIAGTLNCIYANKGAKTQQEIDDSAVKVVKINAPIYESVGADVPAVEVKKFVCMFNVEDPLKSTNNLKLTMAFEGVPADVDEVEMRERLRGTWNATTEKYEGGALEALVGTRYRGYLWCRPSGIYSKK